MPADAAWLEGAPALRIGEETGSAGEPGLADVRWFAGELEVWRHRAGLDCGDPAGLPEPYRLEITGDAEGAARWWQERGCEYEAALALAGTGDPAALRRALDMLHGLGARPAAAVVARRLRALGEQGVRRGPRPATAANPAGLTSREAEVLGLLAARLSNAQIAERLGLSGRTVDNHVSAILRKLGVRTRREAGAQAERLGPQAGASVPRLMLARGGFPLDGHSGWLRYLRETKPGKAHAGHAWGRPGHDGRGVWVKLLVIGGTRFVGRAFVEQAVRHGHDVTVFHRCTSEPEDFPSVEHLHGDRDGQLGLLRGRSWDAVLDTCAYVPRVVREATAVLRDSAGHYTFVSSLSVHPDDMPAGSTEQAPTHQPPFPQTETVTAESYGPLKVACEHEAREAFGNRCLIIRPGYIVGPHDPTDRFTFYLRRAAGGGEMAAPGPPDAPLQVIDVRDLAAFILGRIEAADGGVFGVAGPGERIVMRDVLETARDAAAADTTFTWVSEGFLRAVGDEAQEWFPMWEPQFPGAHTYDAAKAVAAGLRCRPLAQTVADTLTWDQERGQPDLRTGLSKEKERELLATWHSRR